MAPTRHGLGARRATRPGSWPPTPMYISYDDPAPTARSATAEIWRDCARSILRWTAFYLFLAAVVIVGYALGILQWHLTIS